MRIIAIETTVREGSLAALIGEADTTQTVCETRLGSGQRTAQVLAPTLQSLLADVGWPPASIQLVAVAVGPGSFTGLRIGVTTAKTLAYAVGAEVIGIETLAVLAAQASPSPAPLWTVMDAQRQELFAAKFDANSPEETRGAATIVSQDEWLAGLRPGDRVTGPPLVRLRPRLPRDVDVVPEEFWQPTAVAVGKVGWQAYQRGQRDDVWQLVPRYYCPSAAEEKARRQGDKETRKN